ncbi:metalloregulator ArsR/SmtB family transcription factor [Stomatohabitans albus]|uniref:ArsR/SmtB family transcription factor n=1 Tax=Stomatohabitans albus TaxID=3110766 RepID=UPI00300D1D19
MLVDHPDHVVRDHTHDHDEHADSVAPFANPYDYEIVTGMFRALSNPVRAAILHRIAHAPHTVTELVECMELSQPMVSQHLKVLRDATVVKAERCGRTMVYTVADEHVCRVFRLALEHAVEDQPYPPQTEAVHQDLHYHHQHGKRVATP